MSTNDILAQHCEGAPLQSAMLSPCVDLITIGEGGHGAFSIRQAMTGYG